MTKEEVISLAGSVLEEIYQKYKDKGFLSIYFWGSIITPDFDPKTSDIDVVGILSDSADFEEFDAIREYLPSVEPRLNRLQINFFYLSELKGGKIRSRLARLHSAEQAVFDFPYWRFVQGKQFSQSDFPQVSPGQAVRHQVALVNSRIRWIIDYRSDDMVPEYFCKSLAWLCYNIHKLSSPAGAFSWQSLKKESIPDTRDLVVVLLDLKSEHWDRKAIDKKFPWLMQKADTLTTKYT